MVVTKHFFAEAVIFDRLIEPDTVPVGSPGRLLSPQEDPQPFHAFDSDRVCIHVASNNNSDLMTQAAAFEFVLPRRSASVNENRSINVKRNFAMPVTPTDAYFVTDL